MNKAEQENQQESQQVVQPTSSSPFAPVLPEVPFPEQLEALQTTHFNLSSSRGKPTLEQTRRNKMRNELVDSLAIYLSKVLDGTGTEVYRVRDGIALEVPHDEVYGLEQANNLETCNGTVVLTLDLTVQNLEYDAYQENLEWVEESQVKLELAKARQAKKDQAEAKRKKKTGQNTQDK